MNNSVVDAWFELPCRGLAQKRARLGLHEPALDFPISMTVPFLVNTARRRAPRTRPVFLRLTDPQDIILGRTQEEGQLLRLMHPPKMVLLRYQ